ncbi:uncharacterized protein LAESUDRAFT_132873 [Laetiporus sulphureus 93-53]|uniref:F-box domain-containing protein n=1 Tax=Laetiporus sulphureus 93-53 TaxID=1314785 RepID=A0A165EIA1_9APHY|nr:uncharacterized protein LAESUDRAFT_132873 [Laetiporus sulphureus 93-53]KZT07108.1 hypothetical protein LAESUDRAFT_132873 [Laetiporus sulphureus 93-53]
MTLVSLNADVLTYLLSFLSTKHAFWLSLTTKQIHTLAMQQVYRVITLKHPEHVAEVCTLLLRDPTNRLAYVRELRIGGSALDNAEQAVANQIVDVLLHPSSMMIQCLQLGRIEWIVWSEPKFVDALIALRSLTRLELEGIGTKSMAVIERLSSRPRSLCLQFMRFFTADEDLPSLFSNVQRPAIASGSVVEQFTMSSGQASLLLAPASCSQWLALQHLSITNCNLPMSTFCFAFPNVKRIRLQGVTSTLRSHADNPCWTHLDFLDMGNITSDLPGAIFVPWVVTCRVRYLAMGIDLRARIIRETALSIVKLTTPVILELTCNPHMNGKFWRTVADSMRGRLHYLVVILKRDERSSPATHIELLEYWKWQMSTYMSSLGITCIRICCTSRADRQVLQDIPTLLTNVTSSLRYIALEHYPSLERDSWCDGRYDGCQSESTWWRIVRDGSRKSFARVATEIGERVDAYFKSADIESSLHFVDPLDGMQRN